MLNNNNAGADGKHNEHLVLTFDNFHFEVNNANGREDGADDEQGGDSWSR